MKVLVTGSTGFVGPYLVKCLKDAGNVVYGMDNRAALKPEMFYCGNITDSDFVLGVVNDVKPDWVFHLAGYSSVRTSFQEAELVHSINVDGTRNLLDAIQTLVPQARLLYVSSAVVYGTPSKTPTSEIEETRPSSPYAQSRVDAENMLLHYQLPWLVARSFNHTGPGQTAEFVLSDWCRQAAAIEIGVQAPVIKVGNIESVRDFMDVRDIVRIYVELLRLGRPHEIYNVGGGIGYRLGDLLNKILSLVNVPVQIVVDEDKVRSQDTTLLVADITKTSNILRLYSSEYSIDQTLQDILDYWRKQLRN